MIALSAHTWVTRTPFGVVVGLRLSHGWGWLRFDASLWTGAGPFDRRNPQAMIFCRGHLVARHEPAGSLLLPPPDEPPGGPGPKPAN